ncbi:MAG: ArsA family ATPase [Bdellovibrionaceae bacterium]|nr:ArsA family ATPase [Bdellovibrionales bacterium]MCB9085285.1 ArsA family ATPase [Pseudobdellovibrionaceae bacterium]
MAWMFDEYKVIICAGTGGVGKTTLSACLGILAARAGKRTLVLTIDPAKRLADALGIDATSEQEMLVQIDGVSGSLSAAMINPASIFDRFIHRAARRPELAQRILNNSLYRQMSTTLSGSQEFTSLERLQTALDSGKFDLIILDTPPSQHAVDFLYAPQKIYSLFQNAITQWFVQKPGSRGFLQGLFHRGTKTALAALEKVTGSHFIHELSDFFEGVAEIQDEVSGRSIAVHRLLTGPDTAFVLITGFDRAKLGATRDFINELRKGGYTLNSVVVNRCFPNWNPNEQLGQELSGEPEYQKLLDFYQSLRHFNQDREEELAQFQGFLGSLTPLIRVPDLVSDVAGLQGLQRLADKLEPYVKENP